MPSFTIPKDTPIKIEAGVTSYTETTVDHITVTWEENKAERDKKKKQMKQTCEPVCIPTSIPGSIGIGYIETRYHDYDLMDQMYSLDTLNCVPQPCNPAKDVSNNKEHNMSNNIYATAASVNSPVPTDQKQRDYTLGRLDGIKSEKIRGLRKTFGLDDDEAPHSFEELMARIKDGKFIFPKDHEKDYNGPVDVMYMISWRDPSIKKDEAGYTAVKTKLDEAYTTARDTVVLSAADQGLKIIEDFKSLKLS